MSIGQRAAQVVRFGRAIAKGAAAGGVWGAAAGAAMEARKPVAVFLFCVLLTPLLFLLLLPSLVFGGLTNAGNANSGNPIMNDAAVVAENMTKITSSISQILSEGVDDAKERIAQHFTTTDGDNYEIVNPYEENLTGNTAMFISEYCAAKEIDWASISLPDMERVLRENKSHLYTYSFEREEREAQTDDGEQADGEEPATEIWYVYTIAYQGEDYFADAIFHLSEDQKELAAGYVHNLNLFFRTGSSLASGVPMIVPDGYGSGAGWIQSHIDAAGNLDETARTTLFGDAGKTYFASAEEAAPYMRSLKIQVWKVDGTGSKYASTAWVTVHALVADDVQAIFDEIFNDPEHFPINSVGGARFSDTMRHSWGCAIDINPEQNCECNFHSGGLTLTCGYGWWPEGLSGTTEWVGRPASSYHGNLACASPCSIKPNGSVVRAFAAHGWGWGGNGWYGGKGFDFMHFSVLSSGG